MTTATDLLLDGYSRVHDTATAVLDGIDEATLTARVGPGANTVGWLVWHLIRVQDDHIAGVAGVEQRWTADGWFDRFGLPFQPVAHGYGQSEDDVAAVRGIAVELFTGYLDDVLAATRAYVAGLSDADLARVVDDNWDPPVTLAARLISVLNDDLQHAGQAAYVRGVLERR